MRRLLWVSHFVPFPPAGGVLQRGFGLVSGLSRYFEVHLVCFNQPRLVRQSAGGGPGTLDKLVASLEPYCASIQLFSIPAETQWLGRPRAAARAAVQGKSFTETWLHSSQFSTGLADVISRVHPALIHFDTISLAPYGRHTPRSTASSLGHHNIESHMLWRRGRREANLLKRRLLTLEAERVLALERSSVNDFSLQVVCSTVDATRLRRMTRAQTIHVAENGVLAPEASVATLRDKNQFVTTATRFLFVGRMSAYTNRDAAEWLANEIWPKIRSNHPEARLDVVGSEPPTAIRDLANRDQNVTVHGFLSDLSSVVTAGSTFICPVRDGGGTKLKILDAMNRGLPIISHPMALEGLSVIPGKHALVATSADDFLNAAARLIASTELRMSLATAAFNLVHERYSFSAISSELAARFQTLIETTEVDGRR
jgi:polysaccharide biosynthesis protein PslH